MESRIRRISRSLHDPETNDSFRAQANLIFVRLRAEYGEDRMLEYISRRANVDKSLLSAWLNNSSHPVNQGIVAKILSSLQNFTSVDLDGISGKLRPPLSFKK